PGKAKTIGKDLGRGYRVRATVGHIMDLPEKKLGIDVENGFEPDLVPIPGKEKTIAELKSAAKDSKEVLIATDPDREGEAIASHVAAQIRPKRGTAAIPIRRVLFHEITKDAVQLAVQNAGTIDEKKVEAQHILDDLKGRKTFDVTEVKRRERRKNPAAPFTTSTLQQEAAKKLGFGSKRTMRIAQNLYEGIEVGSEGAAGLITYMRTDS